MDKNLDCPPPDILIDLVQGKMMEPELSQLTLHLEECAHCQETARTVPPFDTLIESLRGQAPVADQIAQVVPRPLIERLKQIPRRDTSVCPVAPAEQELNFLAPSQEANEIGRLGQYRILGDKHADARADLFSLGCVLYRLCAGDIPFKAETTMGTLLAIATNHPVAPAELSGSTPPRLSELIMQLLEKDPARRPKSARDVLARLTEIEHSLSGNSTPAPAPRRPTRKRSLLVLAALAFGALAVVAGMIVFWETPDGCVVRIECDDPSIKIAFEDLAQFAHHAGIGRHAGASDGR